MIDSLIDTNVYFEKPIEVTISCNKNINQNGTLEKDDKENSLLSNIDSGDTCIGKLTSYNGNDGILIYNSTTKEIELLGVGDISHIDIDFQRGVKYFIGASKVIATRKSGLTFNADIGDKSIFKVYLDGREVGLFSNDETTITVQGISSARVDDFSKLTIFVYETNIIADDTEFVFTYNNYETIYLEDSFMSLQYFRDNSFNGEEMEGIETISPSQDIGLTQVRNSFKNADMSVLNKVTNTLDVTSYIFDDYLDLIDVIGLNNFRIILINPFFKRCTIFNNCKIDNGVTLGFEKEANTRTYKLDCGNRIEITVHANVDGLYGKGLYGKGVYGANTTVVNSANLGGSLYD